MAAGRVKCSRDRIGSKKSSSRYGKNPLKRFALQSALNGSAPSSLRRADHSAPARTIIDARKLHNTIVTELMNGPYSLSNFARKYGHVSRLMYFNPSSASPTNIDTGTISRHGSLRFGSSQ